MKEEKQGLRTRELEQLADRRLAYALLRVFLGVNIFMHGLSRLMAGPAAFIGKIMHQFANSPLPHWSLVGFGAALPWVEVSLGLLLLLGLWTRFALVAGSLLMILLTFGIALVQEWDVAGLQLIYAIAYAILLYLRRENSYSIDELGARRRTL